MNYIIILNWNGVSDTVDCLKSLYSAEGDFCTIVVDNGSADDSVQIINNHLAVSGIESLYVPIGECIPKVLPNRLCVVLETGENLGFAKGNNYALERLSFTEEDRILLLNNDTVVEPDFLEKLTDFAEQHPQYEVLTPLICYYNPDNVIWNCGGWQKYGVRKYYYAKKDLSCVKETDFIDITFVTGCALFFKPSLLDSSQHIFTEKFFFGEEDFDFCIRMNKEKRKMACVLDSKIYHKVNASTKRHSAKGKIYIHYLNRFIDVKSHYSTCFYFIWSFVNSIYAYLQFLRMGMKFMEALKLIARVNRDARRKDSVSKSDFIEAISLKA